MLMETSFSKYAFDNKSYNFCAYASFYLFKKINNLCIYFSSQLWTPQNVIIFNLASSDFAVSVLGNPVTLAAAITKGWIFGHTICVIYGFFMALFGKYIKCSKCFFFFFYFAFVINIIASPKCYHVISFLNIVTIRIIKIKKTNMSLNWRECEG